MRILVTGGAGFIGSHIVDALLARGDEPFVVDNLSSGRRENLPPQVPLFEADICDAAALERIFTEVRPQAVCHQAAQMSVSRSMREPVYDAEVNIIGLLRVLENAARVGARRVTFASSGGALYGDVYEPADENHACDPFSPYGLSKWVGEQYLRFYARERQIEAVALRYSNVYGPRQNPHGEAGVVAIFSTKMLAAEQVTIFGDGGIVRDYVAVGDVARANAAALDPAQKLAHGFVALNIGTGVATTVSELASTMRQLAGAFRQQRGQLEPVPEPFYGPPRAGDLRSSLIAPGQAAATLGWRPLISLKDGLRDTIAQFGSAR